MFRKLLRASVAVAVIALALSVTGPVGIRAQGDLGVAIEPTFGSGPDTLNPLFCNDNTCSKLVNLMFPFLVAVDPPTAQIAKGAPGGLALDWTTSADGLTYTFPLRQDMYWSDGQPITAKDVKFTFDTVMNPDAQSPLASNLTTVEKVEVINDYAIAITFKVADCTALPTVGAQPIAPAHVLTGDIATLKDSAFSTAPTVTAGPYKFGEYRAGETTVLLANPDYPDLINAQILNAGFVQPVVPDQNVLVEQFLADEVNIIDAPPVARRGDLRADAAAGKSQIFDFPGNAWDYIALNLADPSDPQPGQDDKGNLIAQKPHPLFGDKRVRHALARAIDVDAIIKGAVFGEGTRMAASMIPTSWAINKDLKPTAFDPAAAAKLLDEAGFPLGPDGIRVAKGAMYAPDGTVFKFSLLTNQGNTRREAIGTIVKDQLKQVGIEVEFQAIDFNVLNDTVRSQKFDARVGGWLNAFPDDPDQTALFLPESDIPGAGNNFVSYSNERVTELMRKALRTPGCKLEDRAALYQEIQTIMADDMPYIWLYVINGWYGAGSEVKNFNPLANQLYWQASEWSITK